MPNEPILCPNCHNDLAVSSWAEDHRSPTPTLCGRCRALYSLSEASRVYESRHNAIWREQFITTLLECTSLPSLKDETGIPTKVAIEARIKKISPSVLRAIPAEIRQTLSTGSLDLPEGRGIGLAGPTSIGKTFTLGAFIRGWLWVWQDRAVEHHDWTDGQLPNPRGLVVWLTWPRVFSWLQGHAIDVEAVMAFRRASVRAKLLVIDDLGREGVSSRTSGVAFGHRVLDDVLSVRYDRKLPVMWCTNNHDEFNQIYDSALLARLFDASPVMPIDSDYLRSF